MSETGTRKAIDRLTEQVKRIADALEASSRAKHVEMMAGPVKFWESGEIDGNRAMMLISRQYHLWCDDA